ncbi:MAG: magnesium transporter [Chlamydiota bacterium]
MTSTVPETRAHEIQDILRKKLEEVAEKASEGKKLGEFADIAKEYSAADLAYSVVHIPAQLRFSLYQSLSSVRAKMAFMIHADLVTRTSILKQASDSELETLFGEMPADEGIRILEHASDSVFMSIMRLLPKKKSGVMSNMRTCPKDCAGRLMTDMFFSFSVEDTIGDASLVIRDHPEIDFAQGIFVVDVQGKLQGYVPVRAMVVHPSSTSLKEIMCPVLHKVSIREKRQEVIDVVERYKLESLAVVDEQNALIGVITSEDVVEALEELADETMAMIAGTVETPHTETSTFARFFSRSPWLFVTLLSGFLNVGMMSTSGRHFGEEFFFIFFFVPLVTGLSGNIGIQCSTVLVRNFAVGSLSNTSRVEASRKELASGLFSGLVFGVLCGVFIYLFGALFCKDFGLGAFSVACIVSCGLIGACFAGTLLGVFSPLFFMRVGVDPAISSGPIITAFNDFISMAIYFFIAWSLHLVFFL